MTAKDAYHALSAWSLARRDAEFIHQHVVDAFAAQTADEHSKPIGVTFALLGLYLHVEKRWTGRQVQRAHMQLARRKRTWPEFVLPDERGDMTVLDVMREPEGAKRDAAIHAWCASVWEALAVNRQAIADLLRSYGIE